MELIISFQRGRMSEFDYLGGSAGSRSLCWLNWMQTITALHRQLYLPAKYVTHNKHMLLTDKGRGETVTVGEKRKESKSRVIWIYQLYLPQKETSHCLDQCISVKELKLEVKKNLMKNGNLTQWVTILHPEMNLYRWGTKCSSFFSNLGALRSLYHPRMCINVSVHLDH